MDHSKHHHHDGHEHAHDDEHAHDGHEHTHDERHDHSHGAGTAASAHGHSHGEPTGNAIEKIGFTRSQFLRMCLAGVAAGAVAPSAGAQTQAPKASPPRTDSYDDPLIFDNDYVFTERFDGRKDYFSSKATAFYPTAPRQRAPVYVQGHHSHSIVNFVPNAWKAPLYPAGQGVEDYDNHFSMARNTMALHVEQFPTGTYERCHRHGPGSTIILLDGNGFSLLWPPEIGTTPFKDGKQSQVQLAEWKEGTLLVPPLQWYHQHFNSGKTPARFVKLGGWNNDLYPFTTTLVSDPGRTDIDYPDEDPKVRQIFAERLTAAGGEVN